MSVVLVRPANHWQSPRSKWGSVNGRRVTVHRCDSCKHEAPFDPSAGWRRSSDLFDDRSWCSDRCEAVSRERPTLARCEAP